MEKKKIRILFAYNGSLFPHISSGAEISTHLLLKHFALKGHKCYAIGCREDFVIRNGLYNNLYDEIEEYEHFYRCFLFENPYSLNNDLYSLIDSLNPDVILTQTPGTENVVKYSLSKNIPIIFYIHSLQEGFTHKDCFKTLNNYGDKISAIVSVSKFIKQQVYDYFKLQSYVIYPIIEMKKMTIPNNCNKKYITLVNSHKYKGIFTLIELAKNIKEENFLIIESWSKTDKDLVRKIEQIDNITILPFQENIVPILANSKLLLVPSTCQEAFCRTIVEAKYLNVPSLANDIGGISEALGKNEYLIKYPYCIKDWFLKTLKMIEYLNNGCSPAAVINFKNICHTNPETVIEKFENILKNFNLL